MSDYVPDLGDIVWLSFDPRTGHEQSGHRPALVMSPAAYNEARGMMIACPLTSRVKGYPFEVIVAGDPDSAVLVDQVRSLDWRARAARFKQTASPDVVSEVQAKLKALLGL